MTINVEVISDVVCPWCYIGKRRLAQALELYRASADAPLAVHVSWRPFQLNPRLPLAGVDRAEYVAAKFGARAEGTYARVGAVGRSVGIDFAFERILRQPNTLPAHQLIDFAQRHGKQEQMVETLFRAYFIEGADLTRFDALVALAQRAGLQAAAARACLDDDVQRQEVAAEDERARAAGVNGVPFFVFDHRLAVSGAQEPEVLLRALEQVAVEAVPDA